jgi:transmembrane sensor
MSLKSFPVTDHTNTSEASHPIPPDIARRAVEWLVELQSDPASDSVRLEWQRWRGEHPDNERAWRRIEAVNGKLQLLASPAASAITHATLTRPRSGKRRQVGKALAILLLVGGTTWVAEEKTPLRQWTSDYHTAVGEQRTLTLADGTRLTLNTDSAINVDFNDMERRVKLVSGEIFVATARDSRAGVARGAQTAGRPFLVETAQGQLRALGTRFLVRQQMTSSRLAVFEGAVEISPRNASDRPRVLQAGQDASFTHTKITLPQPASEFDAAWTDGMIVASGMRLADFLAELNRYRPGRLSCDPALADLRVSGTYPLADTDKILESLHTTLPLEVHAFTRYWVTLRPAKSRP